VDTGIYRFGGNSHIFAVPLPEAGLMSSSSAEGRGIRITSAGHLCFAAVMIWLGVM
jgi:hypothetical protein